MKSLIVSLLQMFRKSEQMFLLKEISNLETFRFLLKTYFANRPKGKFKMNLAETLPGYNRRFL